MSSVSVIPEYERLPFAPGSSPFRVKGVAYRGHGEYVDKYVAGGLAAQLAAVVDPKLREFLSQTFLAASWYDVFPLVAAGYVCGRITGRTLPDFLRVRARYQAEQDMHGVYRMAMTVASPELMAEKVPKMMQQYFDFGSTSVTTTAPQTREVVVDGVPAPLAPWLGPIFETFVLTALEYNGTTRPRAKQLPFRSTGVAHGVDVGALRLAVSWSK